MPRRKATQAGQRSILDYNTKTKVVNSISDQGPLGTLTAILEKEEEDKGAQVSEPDRSKPRRRIRQRSLLEYNTPVKSRNKKNAINVDAEVYQSDGSQSDTPRKFRFESPGQSPSSGSDNKEETDILAGQIRRKRSGQRSSLETKLDTRQTSPSLKRSRNVVISDDDDTDGRNSSPKRRRLVKGKRLVSYNRGELSSEDEQLIEEAQEEETVVPSRLRNKSRKNEFVRHLERLKRKRKGEKIESEPEEENNDYISDEEAESAYSQNDIFAEAQSLQSYDFSDDCDDFIVADDEGAIELPPMFNMDTFQDLSHHFKIVCQLFVHLSIKRRGRRTKFMKEALKNAYFSVPLNMARRKLLGLRDSLVASSIWKPEFRKPLETYPEFTLQQLDFAVPHCDACNLSSRVSTLQGLLRGEKYDHATYQSKGKEIFLDWNLGRFCAARAQIFHKLTHWEYTLFHRLDLEIDYLRKTMRGRDIESDDRIFVPSTKGPPPPEDLDDADGWMEWLDGRGIIDGEWLEIKAMMDKAHKLEAKGKGGEEDVEYS